jgi:hypothetical protein
MTKIETMTDDLVKQLRDMARMDGCRASIAAADRIEALTAELDARVQTSAIYCDDCGWAMKFPDCGCVYCGFHRLEKERDALTADRRFILEERDRTFALMLARAEKAEAEVQRWQGLFDEKHNLMLEQKARAENAEADNARLTALLTEAAEALDAAGSELSDFANCLSREPWAANNAYEAAIYARSALNPGKADT